ncbi:MAG: pimeloyl-ACP methyl ester carboxylesterase [Myxococcota bacterium]|jgi:pimeloyl-ACP methyl ester carboxylesterase
MKNLKPSDPELASVGELAVAIEGGGAPLIAIHGLPGSHRDYRWLAGALAGRLRFIRPDMPGFGQSAVRAPGLTVPVRAEAILRLMDALEISTAAVMGHSMGGPVAFHLAAHHPDRIVRLALLASVGVSPHRVWARSGATWAGTLFGIPGLRQLLTPRLRAVYAKAGFPSSISDADRVLAVRQVGSIRFDQHAEAVALLTCPTLVAWTIDDPLVESEISDELAEKCPKGPRFAFPTGGHNLQKTRAVELADALTEFVESPHESIGV